jgi:MFS family permease
VGGCDISVESLIYGFGGRLQDRRRARRGQTPLFSVRLLRNGSFVAGAATEAVRQMYIAGLLFVVPLFLQAGLGFNALESGLVLVPLSVMGFIAAFGAARLGERFAAKRLIQAGMIVLAVGVLPLYGVTSLQLTIAQTIIPMGVISLGLGVTVAKMVDLTLSTVHPERVSEASGVSNTFRELGNSFLPRTEILSSVELGSEGPRISV